MGQPAAAQWTGQAHTRRDRYLASPITMPSERIAQLRALLAEAPNDKTVRFALAMERKRAGDTAGAAKELKALTESDPGYMPPYYQLALVLAAMGRTEDAVRACEAGALQGLVNGDRKARAELEALKTGLSNA